MLNGTVGCIALSDKQRGETTTRNTEQRTPLQNTTIDTRTDETISPKQSYEFDWSGELLESQNDSKAPSLELTLRNTSQAMVSVGFGPVAPFVDPFGESDAGDGLLLYNENMGTELNTTTSISANCRNVDTEDISIHDILRTP